MKKPKPPEIPETPLLTNKWFLLTLIFGLLFWSGFGYLVYKSLEPQEPCFVIPPPEAISTTTLEPTQ